MRANRTSWAGTCHNQTGLSYIVDFIVGSTAGFFWHDPKDIVIIYTCDGKIHACIQIACGTCVNQRIYTNLVLRLFDILLVILTSAILICTCGCLMNLSVLVFWVLESLYLMEVTTSLTISSQLSLFIFPLWVSTITTTTFIWIW